MAPKPPSFSETTWLGASVLILGTAASILALAYVFTERAIILLALGAGYGWAVATVAFVLCGKHRRRVAELETQLGEANEQTNTLAGVAREASAAAREASAASKAVAELFRPSTSTAQPRRRKQKDDEQ